MFCVYTEVMAQDDTVTFSKTTPHFQLLPKSKVDQSAFMRYRLYSTKKSYNTYLSIYLYTYLCIYLSFPHF